MIQIKPAVVYNRLEKAINDSLSASQLPPQFSVAFKIKQQTLQFNMIDEQDIKLIIEALKTTIEHIQNMVTAGNKPQHSESMYFPFGKHIDRTRATMIIDIHYKKIGDFMGPRIRVSQISNHQ